MEDLELDLLPKVTHLLVAKRPDAAEELVQAVLSTNPQSHAGLLTKAMIQRYRGETREAVQTLQDGIRYWPSSAEMYDELAGLHLIHNRHQDALDILDRLLAGDPDNPEWLTRRAECLAAYARVGGIDPSERDIRRAAADEAFVRADKATPDGAGFQGRILVNLDRGRPDLALAEAERLLATDPSDPFIAGLAVAASARAELWSRAAELVEASRRISPVPAELNWALGATAAPKSARLGSASIGVFFGVIAAAVSALADPAFAVAAFFGVSFGSRGLDRFIRNRYAAPVRSHLPTETRQWFDRFDLLGHRQLRVLVAIVGGLVVLPILAATLTPYGRPIGLVLAAVYFVVGVRRMRFPAMRELSVGFVIGVVIAIASSVVVVPLMGIYGAYRLADLIPGAGKVIRYAAAGTLAVVVFAALFSLQQSLEAERAEREAERQAERELAEALADFDIDDFKPTIPAQDLAELTERLNQGGFLLDGEPNARPLDSERMEELLERSQIFTTTTVRSGPPPGAIHVGQCVRLPLLRLGSPLPQNVNGKPFELEETRCADAPENDPTFTIVATAAVDGADPDNYAECLAVLADGEGAIVLMSNPFDEFLACVE